MSRVIESVDVVADTLGGLLDHAVANRPDEIFARFESSAFTVQQIDSMARRIAASFRRDGLSRGDRVAAFMYPSPWHLALLLGCARTGVVWCPINVSLARDDLGYTLRDLDPSLVMVDRELLDAIDKLDASDLGRVQARIVVHDQSPDGAGTIDSEWLSKEEATGPCTLGPSDTLAVIFSGGTTGRPKGIMVSQFFAVSCGLRLSQMANFREQEVFFSTLQFFHAWTSLTVMPFCLQFGHVFAFWKWWSASRFLQEVRRHQATIVDPYVGMAATLLHTEEQDDDDNLPTRLCIAGWGGDEVTAKQIRRRFEERFGIATLQMYALTEVGALASIEVEGEEQRFGSSGKPRGWYDIVIADEDGFVLPSAEIGEILVRPRYPNIIAKGYLNRAEDTLVTWRDLWVHTGDLGRFDEDGYLYFVGRSDHFLRRRGELVSVGEVEAVIGGMDGVDEVAVVAVPSSLGEDDIKAFVRPLPRHDVSPRDVVDYCTERLAYFKVPMYVEIVEDFPRSTAKQEIERFLLKQRPLGQPVVAVDTEAGEQQ